MIRTESIDDGKRPEKDDETIIGTDREGTEWQDSSNSECFPLLERCAGLWLDKDTIPIRIPSHLLLSMFDLFIVRQEMIKTRTRKPGPSAARV